MARFDSPGALQQAIQHWLNDHVEPLAANETTGFSTWRDRFRGPLFVYGSGGLGQKLVQGLLAKNIAVEGFCDSNPARWQQQLLGLPILSPEAAVARAGHDGGFIISTWSLGKELNNAAMQQKLESLGVRHWTFFTSAFWEYPSLFLPHYRIDRPSALLPAIDDILRVAGLFADTESRAQFFVQLQMLATTTFDETSYSTPGDTYFPKDIVAPATLRRFVDCGAFDGDTLRTLVTHANGLLEHYWGFEPDPKNCERLRGTVHETAHGGRLIAEVFACAVGSHNGVLRFDATGDVGARLAAAGSIEVECRRLDDLLRNHSPTFIKMDIEGAELDALAGAEEILTASQPACAVCVYHLQDHLWNVPLRLHAALPRHSLHFRAHSATSDVVCYAMPSAA